MNWKIYSIVNDDGRTCGDSLLSDPKVPGYLLSSDGEIVAESATVAVSLCNQLQDSFEPLRKARLGYLTNSEQKVAYLNNLHAIVSKRCPVNKAGSPIVSDYDKIAAEFWEHFLAIVCVVTGRKP